MFIIYQHTNKTTSKCYVGWTSKSIDERWRRHVATAKCGSKYHFHRAISLYGESDWISIVLETLATQSEALLAEKKWITFYQSNDPNHGYNSSTGGEGAVPNVLARQHLSEAQHRRFMDPNEQLKISLGAKKRPPISEETRALLRETKLGQRNPQFGRTGKMAARHGKRHSDETKAKIAIKKRGQRLSKEACQKCSEASKRRWKKKYEQDQNSAQTEVSVAN